MNKNDFKLGNGVIIEKGAYLNVIGGRIGDRTIIRKGARVEGNSVVLGRESYIDIGATIGGDGAFLAGAFLNAGDFFTMQPNSYVQITGGVECGHEVGLGIGAMILTHQAFLPVYEGYAFYVGRKRIPDKVWIPPNFILYSGGEDLCSPKGKNDDQIIFEIAKRVPGCRVVAVPRTYVIICGDTFFDIKGRTIEGPVTDKTELLKDILRLYGIRFRYFNLGGDYRPWEGE